MVERPPHLIPPPLDEADPKVQMNVRLPRSLIATLDLRRASLGGHVSRDEWVCRAIVYALRTQPGTSSDGTSLPSWHNGSRTTRPRRPL